MCPAGLDVVGGGAAAVDTILFVDGTLGDSKARVLRREQRFGGNTAIALVAAARLGARTAFLGHLPDHTSGPELLAFFTEEEVDFSRARTLPTNKAIVSTILVDRDGKRFIAFDDDTQIGLPADLNLDLVRSAKVLLVDEYGLAGGVRAAAAVRDAGGAVVADIERATEPAVRELFDLADHLVLPRDLALAWTGTASPAEAVQALWRPDRAAVVITGGADGCWYRAADDPDATTVRFYPAITVNVVDTTGCGDVFHGTYAARLALGGMVADCIATGTAAAAHCATHPGGIGPRLAATGHAARR